jgi:DNA-binding MarR family transcriptional regulator
MADETIAGTSGQSRCTCLRLRKATRRVSQIYDRQLEAAGLTITQFGLLAHLKGLGEVGVGALAEMLIMDPTTLTRNLRPLERRGLVEISPDPRDRRARRLRLTASGRSAWEQARPAWARAQRQIELALGGPDAAALNDALDLVLERLAP